MSRIGEIQTPLPTMQAVLIGLLAAIAVTAPTIWNVVQDAETVVHEGAHALAGIVIGRKIQKVEINKDGGGSTTLAPKTGAGNGLAAFFFVGYIGASAAGLIAAGLISIGYIAFALFLGLLLYVVVLWFVHNWFGGTVILAWGVLLYVVLRYTTVGVETAVAYFVTWFLLISGTKVALGNVRRPKDITDAKNLAEMTHIFRSAWIFLWLILTIAALVVGGAILIHALCGIRIGLHGLRYVSVGAGHLPGPNAVTAVNRRGQSADRMFMHRRALGEHPDLPR